MTREEAIKELQEDIELYVPLHGTIDDIIRDLPDGRLITALEMAIKALEQEQDMTIAYLMGKYEDKEPCTVSVSEKEPDEISEEISIKFFKNTLKLRWHEYVIYNVEWLKKNWQTEMDIVCGVKPCTDAVSRQLSAKDYLDMADAKAKKIKDALTVTQKSGKWIPVSERLPKKYTYTLWCASSGYVRSDYFNGEYWEDAKKLFYDVVAWMPLPKPYEPRERSDKE